MKKTLVSLVSFLCYLTVFGQQSVNTTGGSVSNSSGSVSYSIGQVAYQYVSNATGSMNQGVQQAYEITTLGLEEKIYAFSLSTFPNPTSEQLTLRVGKFNKDKLNYKLLDATGKIICEALISEQETNLDLKSLPSATYFVEVHNEDNKVQTFKIIKNQ